MVSLELALVLALAASGAWLAWSSGLLAARLVAAGGLLATALYALTAAFGAASLAFRSPIRIEHGEAPSDARGHDPTTESVGSGACRSCHPSEHATWHRSFHRTMTQLATPETALGPWEHERLEVEGRTVELFQRGAELWARLPDPELVAAAALQGSGTASQTAPLVTRRVLLTTGSHHHQVYWVGGARGNELRLLPITYLIAEKRYVARRDAFLQPPDAPPHAIRWNSNCIQCHATRGEPQHDLTTDRFDSAAAELGIACEACHGPGAAHVRKQQNPLTRFAAHLTNSPDPSIVNPARLGAERASEVCGQCHAYFIPRDQARFWTEGFADFRPGDALDRTRTLLTPESGASVDTATENLFWNDGTIRVGGRELNGLRASACFSRGHGERQLSCLSCHSMHASEPNDQLRREPVNAPCERCHEQQASHLTEHTHHAPSSAGSSCVACHMPFTSYALFTAMRSHRIDNPSALNTATTGRPNACNLCHLDRSLDWTARALANGWGVGNAAPHAPGDNAADPGRGAVGHTALDATARAPSDATARFALDATARDALGSAESRAVLELLRGDAATRVVVAAAFGREEARRTAGSPGDARVLAELLDDPYAAVRKVACDSLRSLAGYGDLRCDFTADAEGRRAARAEALRRVRASRGERSLSDDRVTELLQARDERPITISE